MVKRLSLVLAFIGRPALITLDEPLVTLDQDSIPVLYNYITACCRENNISFLISSHQDIATGALPEEKVLSAAGQTITLMETETTIGLAPVCGKMLSMGYQHLSNAGVLFFEPPFPAG